MANVAIFNEGATPENVLKYLKSVDTSKYVSRTDVVINPSPPAVPLKYWKHVAGTIVEMTQAEKDAVDASLAAAALSRLKITAKALYDGQQEQGQALRALVLVLLDEINTLRGWMQDFKDGVATANNLADVKTLVAGLPNTPDRTLAQAKTAIQSEIDAGSVDEP